MNLIICVMCVVLVLLRDFPVEINIRGGHMGFRFCIFNEGGGEGFDEERFEERGGGKISFAAII